MLMAKASSEFDRSKLVIEGRWADAFQEETPGRISFHRMTCSGFSIWGY
jgi:hypothetical protein